MKVKIVLGMSFGDEGKGLTTDYLCSHSQKPIVVRFNGGHQAGHTVQVNVQGKEIRHIHSSYGSGTLRGVPTYISEHCCVNPVAIMNEYKELFSKGFNPPMIYIHPLAKVTTPYDIYYNERDKENLEHGTCGVGIGATMKRHLTSGYKIHAIDLLYPKILNEKLWNIWRKYYECPMLLKYEQEFFDSLKSNLFKIADYSILGDYRSIIFEGAQGILLDMDHGIFPHVTYSNTTSKNAFDVIEKANLNADLNDIKTYYITRCYQTRHGNGWMSNEEDPKLIHNEMETNIDGGFQGKFRIGEIDYDLLNYSLEVDGIYNKSLSKNLMITCMDQRPDFEFDHSKINQKFNLVYESYRQDSKGITIRLNT